MPFGHPPPATSKRERPAFGGDVRRQKAAILFALFVAGQAFSGLHLAVEEHATCEHGDVVHAASQSEVGLAPLTLLASAQASVEGQDQPTAIEDEHDHCDVLARSQQMAVSDDRLVATPGSVSSVRAAPEMPSTFVLLSTRLYRLAPKQSPPQA